MLIMEKTNPTLVVLGGVPLHHTSEEFLLFFYSAHLHGKFYKTKL